MSEGGFLLLAIDSNPDGVWVLLRCSRCGEPSGFHFQDEPLWGRYPILCGCGAEAVLELRRPSAGPSLVREIRGAFSWASIQERRLIPKSN